MPKSKKAKAPTGARSTRLPPGVALSPEAKKAAAEAEAVKAVAKFHKELAEKYKDIENPKPHLECRIFPLPDYCSVTSVAMRELDGDDDLMSSYWADFHATEAVKSSQTAAFIADQREGIRIALVAVEGRQVNDDGAPYMACDSWTSKTWRFLLDCFSELNGVSQEDLKNAVRGSLPLGTTPGHGANQEGELADE